MTTRIHHLATGMLVTGVLMTGACAAPNPPSADEQAAAEAMARVDQDQRSDAAITTEIQARYYGDDDIRGRRIDVRVNDGMVALDGVVADNEARARAVSLARDVEGVREIDDRLELAADVDPDADSDGRAIRGPASTAGERSSASNAELGGRWITTKIQASYFADRDIKARNIDVTTTDTGIVTLEGEVHTNEARERAGQIARAADGVRRVDNHLRVVREDASEARADAEVPGSGAVADTPDVASGDIAAPTDGWVTMKIQSKYFLDPDVAGRRIDVDTQDGIVTLSGAVKSETERRQALALARNTDGVHSVTDQLQVTEDLEAAERQDTARRSAGDVIDDAWLTTKIQSKFFLDDEVKGRTVDVAARDGIVTLTGAVASETARRTAEAIARETDGVSRVVNQLQVAQDISDTGDDEDADTDPMR